MNMILCEELTALKTKHSGFKDMEHKRLRKLSSEGRGYLMEGTQNLRSGVGLEVSVEDV